MGHLHGQHGPAAAAQHRKAYDGGWREEVPSLGGALFCRGHGSTITKYQCVRAYYIRFALPWVGDPGLSSG